MKEDFLQFIWKQQLFFKSHLYTTKGNKIKILDVGMQNFCSGPDFFDARIKIDDVVWAGNVEIHVNSSAWNYHGHSKDVAYENVILHVVLNEDAEIKLSNGRTIPCLELKFPKELKDNYQQLMSSQKWIPCFDEIKNVERFFVRSWLDRMLFERLERKSNDVQEILEYNNNSWEETFYHVIARYFGMKLNADPFQQLARSIPLKVLARQKTSKLQLEAILFGQSGLFKKFTCSDTYLEKLKTEYQFLARKYQLKPLSPGRWKLSGLRPLNFPTIRIAQFADLIKKSEALFSQILNAGNVDDLYELLHCKASGYWSTHYSFGIESKHQEKPLGRNGIDALLINCIVPVLFHYGTVHDSQSVKRKAYSLLDALSPEKNSTTKKWRECGVVAVSACHTQALLQLKSNYCDEFKCLQCEFGNRIIRKKGIVQD